MIQDIFPSKLDNNYMDHKMTSEDYVLWFNADGKAYVWIQEDGITFAKGSDVKETPVVYLFSVDDQPFFRADPADESAAAEALEKRSPVPWKDASTRSFW